VTVIMILTIAGNYPGNIKTYTKKQKNGNWSWFMYLMRHEEIHRLLLSTTPIFDTKEMAEGNAKNIVDGCIGWVENKENMKPIEKFI